MENKGRPELLKRERESGIFAYIVAAVAIVFLTVVFVGVWFRGTYTAYQIEKESMRDTLSDGDWVYAEHGAEAERGDIVILDVSSRPSFSADTIIKRLIAVEGDTVKGVGGKVYLRYAGTEDFVALDEPYAVGAYDFAERRLGDGEIFVLGDNRVPSYDSSKDGVGPLSEDEIVAVVPQWSITHKKAITNWENFRTDVRKFFRHIFA